MIEEALFTVDQAATILKVHPLTIRRYIKEGKLKAIKLAGNIRLPTSSIDTFGQVILPTNYSEQPLKRPKIDLFSSDDPIFRLKGRGMSLKASKF